jgi:hypothetical protein
MRNIKVSIKALVLLPFIFLLSCNSFLDVNETPNNPLAVPPKVLLPTALAGAAFANANDLNRFASTIMDYNYGAAGGPGGWDIYNTDGSNFGNQWRFEIYGGALVNCEELIKAADKVGAKSYSGIAKIIKAYTFSIATDTWGDVPYSQALKGDAFPQPRIDKQEDIYKGNASLGIQSLFDLVREGIADLAATSVLNPTTDDIVYGGTIANWRRAGYTLMLKMAMQISAVEPALATSIINEVIAADPVISNTLISSNAQNLGVKFGSATGSQSPIFTWTYVSLFQNDMMTSTGYVNLLQGLGDPRLDLFITKPTGAFLTYVNGSIQTLAPVANRSKWTPLVTGVNGVGPVRLLTNAQRAFLMAEAKLILPGVNITQTAQALFQEGITAAMSEFGVPAGSITTYITNNGALTGTTAQQQEKIIIQKYIASTGNGLEAWNDYRRTGYPAFPEHLNAIGIDGKRPTRAVYINEEVQRNPNFTPIIQPNVKVWWDVN